MEYSRFDSDSENALVIDRSEVSFAHPVTGKAAIVSLRIKQLGASTPVTLSVANPSWFTLSHNLNESTFAASLSFIPPPEGCLIYVRYMPKSARGHRTFLVATNPYEAQTVILKGLPAGLGSWLLSPQ